MNETTAQKSRRTEEALLKRGAAIYISKPGEIVEGEIIEKKGTEVYVDLGPIGTGIIYGREYYSAHEFLKNLNVGDKISAKIIDLDNEDGYVELSLREAGEEKRWLDFKKLMDEKAELELPVLEANRGGLILELEGIRGFLPTSQLSLKHYPRVEGGDKEKILEELRKLVGKTLKVRILDANPRESKLIFTEKEEDAELIKEALSKYKVGDTVEGEITGVVDFGAFMRFDDSGVEGLIHISEIDWTLVENPRDILKAGDKVKAKIIDIQGDKVSLSLKALKENPWNTVAKLYKKGDSVRGKVTKFNPFGAFVELESGVQGLIHISEFGNENKMKETLEIGKEYEFTVLLVDPDEHRLSLALRG